MPAAACSQLVQLQWRAAAAHARPQRSNAMRQLLAGLLLLLLHVQVWGAQLHLGGAAGLGLDLHLQPVSSARRSAASRRDADRRTNTRAPPPAAL